MSERLKTSEAQIEKDWEIIESQGNQLDNLHQQFIEQRDENLKHMRLVQERDEEIEKLSIEIRKIEQSVEPLSHIDDLYIKLTEQQEEIQQSQEIIAKKDQQLLELSKDVTALEANGNKQVLVNVGALSLDSLDQSNIDNDLAVGNQTENEQQQINEYRGKIVLLEETLKEIKEKHQIEIDDLQKLHDVVVNELKERSRIDIDQLQREHQTQVKKFQEMLKDKEQYINKLVEEMTDIRQRAKLREEELERVLLEKEDGIEKLHSMIRELEKSLSNSQVHIEGLVLHQFHFLSFDFSLSAEVPNCLSEIFSAYFHISFTNILKPPVALFSAENSSIYNRFDIQVV